MLEALTLTMSLIALLAVAPTVALSIVGYRHLNSSRRALELEIATLHAELAIVKAKSPADHRIEALEQKLAALSLTRQR